MVIEKARVYALLKHHGAMIDEHGSLVTFSASDAKFQLDWAQTDLLRSIDKAFIEDAMMGAALHQKVST